MNAVPARVVFQCAACRALTSAHTAFVDETRTRAALVCDVCGAASWLPLAGAPSASVVDVGPAHVPAGLPPRAPAASMGPAPMVAPLSAAPASSVENPTTVVPGPWTSEQLERIRTRLSALPAEPGGREVADGFLRLLSRWSDAQEHKQLLKKASMLGRLPDAGQCYRIVLDEVPGDPVAKRAQGDIIAMAMTTMQGVRDFGSASTDASKTRRELAMALVVLLLLALGVVTVLPRLLRAVSGEAMIEGASGTIAPGSVAGESAR